MDLLLLSQERVGIRQVHDQWNLATPQVLLKISFCQTSEIDSVFPPLPEGKSSFQLRAVAGGCKVQIDFPWQDSSSRPQKEITKAGNFRNQPLVPDEVSNLFVKQDVELATGIVARDIVFDELNPVGQLVPPGASASCFDNIGTLQRDNVLASGAGREKGQQPHSAAKVSDDIPGLNRCLDGRPGEMGAEKHPRAGRTLLRLVEKGLETLLKQDPCLAGE